MDVIPAPLLHWCLCAVGDTLDVLLGICIQLLCQWSAAMAVEIYNLAGQG